MSNPYDPYRPPRQGPYAGEDPYVHVGPGPDPYRPPAQYGREAGAQVWIWILAVAVILLGGIGGGAYWLADSGRLAWMPGLGGKALKDVWLVDIAARGNTVVAIGESRVDYQGRPLVLVSKDAGKSWNRTSAPPPAAGRVSLQSVEADDRGWILLGTSSRGAPILWTSGNGQGWDRLSTGTRARSFTTDDQVEKVVRTASGYLLVGVRYAGTGGTSEPVVWTSRSGTSWRRLDGLASRREANSAVIHDVAVRNDIVVVSASVEPAGGGFKELYWRSTDGGWTWTVMKSPTIPGAEHVSLSPSVNSTPGHFTILARTLYANHVLTSKRGREWSSLAELPRFPEPKENGIGSFMSMTSSNTGVAVLLQGRDERLILIRSDDGRTWSSGGKQAVFTVPGKATYMHDFAVTPTTVVGIVNRHPRRGVGAQIHVAPNGEVPQPVGLPSG